LLCGERCRVPIYCDSQYIINVLQKWAPVWQRKGWRKADGGHVQNLNLVKEMLERYREVRDRIELRKVVAHSGNRWNDEVDRLANEARIAGEE